MPVALADGIRDPGAGRENTQVCRQGKKTGDQINPMHG